MREGLTTSEAQRVEDFEFRGQWSPLSSLLADYEAAGRSRDEFKVQAG